MKIFHTARILFYVIRFAFRFVSGRTLSGERKTDATFLRPATRSLDPSHTALRWEMMRGASRMAWRMAGVYLLLILPAGILLLRIAVEIGDIPRILYPGSVLLIHLLLIGSGTSAWVAIRLGREYGFSILILARTDEGSLRIHRHRIEGRREWSREKVLPVARAVSIILTVPIPDREAARWVTVPKTYQEPAGNPVEIRLPASFTGADEGVKKRLVSAVGHKLGMRSVSASWQTEGSAPRVLLSVPPEPPEDISFSDVADLLRRVEEYRPLLAMVGSGEVLHAEMIEDSPHIAVNAGPGAGKSTLAKLIIMQVMRWGWGVVVLDWKMTKAFSWLAGLPGVTYLSSIEDIHDMGIRIAQEIDIRKTSGMDGRARVLVVRDEWNVTADLLLAYWQDYRATLEPEERRTTPVKSPALRGYAVLDYAGREFGVHDLCIAQRFSARIFNGNADIRECFNIRLMARYSDQTRKMLAPDIKPFPKKSNTPGRWTIVAGSEVAVGQVPFVQNDEAREFALGGKECPLTPFSSSYGDTVRQRSNMRPTLGDQLPAQATTGSQDHLAAERHALPSVDARKLSDMVDALIPLGITLKVLRLAAGSDQNGDPAFPEPHGGSPNKGYTYDFQAVTEWARRRHASMTAERENA